MQTQMDDKTRAAIRLAAMNALARREHSQAELAQKLVQKFPEHEQEIGAVLDCLAAEGLQSDQRFAEAYCRAKSARGYGPHQVQNGLRVKGIAADLAVEVVDAMDWLDLAAQAVAKKYGGKPCADVREKARRIRFLQYRGFTGEHIRQVLKAD